MPIIATENMKNYDMYIDENNKRQLYFYINNKKFDCNEFRENFLPNFCNTVYKFQGGKIDEPYNICDVNKMDIKELYTALSRTTKLEYIHLNCRYLCKQYSERKRETFIIKNSYFNTDFHKGKIYEIKFQFNDKYYVGSTTKTLQEQRLNHINNPKSAIYKYRNDAPKIKLICNCPCKDKKTLEKIENSYINEYKQKYGDKLLNTKGIKKVKTIKNEFKVEMENQKQLKDRIEKLKMKSQIKDNTINNYLSINIVIDGKRVYHKRRYNEKNKNKAIEQLSEIQQKIIKEFSVDWE